MPIDPKDEWICEDLARNDFRISDHAWKRMKQRGVQRADICECGRTSTDCVWQQEHESFLVTGFDLDGDPLSVAVAIEDGLLIATVKGD